MTKTDAVELLKMVAERWAKEQGYVRDESAECLYRHPEHQYDCMGVSKDGGAKMKYIPTLVIMQDHGEPIVRDVLEVAIDDEAKAGPLMGGARTRDFCNVKVYAQKKGVTWAAEILGLLQAECSELVM